MTIDQEQKLGVVIPAGTHIRDPIMRLLDNRGFNYELWANGRLHADVPDEPFTFTFQNHADVIRQVAKGVFGAGFVGSDRLLEYLASLEEDALPNNVQPIGRFEVFNPSLRLALLVRDNPIDNERYQKIVDLRGTRIVTSYQTLTRKFLDGYFPGEKSLPVEIDGEITGKEEGQVDGYKAAAAAVIVDTGAAMRANGLRELEGGTIMEGIQPVLIMNPEYFQNRGKQQPLLDQFMRRLQGSQRSSRGCFRFTHRPQPPFLSDRATNNSPATVSA